jgi:manganese-dependent inorganic pyrophosphatase
VTAIIIPYSNPDLDGVACAITLANLQGAPWSAHIVGEIDEETKAVLAALGFVAPPQAPNWAGVEQIWLVDTHHPNQLPADLPRDLVVRVTDHHPGGAPDHFPNAAIENELVGAAATLVAERFRGGPDRIPSAEACLLQAAILSNTLDFKAPATSSRDHAMFGYLGQIAPLPTEVVRRMAIARRSKLTRDTRAIVESDVKIFDTPHGQVAVSQVEVGGALDLLEREDLRPCLARLAEALQVNAAMINLVDLDRVESALLSTSPALISLLGSALGESPDALGIVRARRVLQRKSDIVPYLA